MRNDARFLENSAKHKDKDLLFVLLYLAMSVVVIFFVEIIAHFTIGSTLNLFKFIFRLDAEWYKSIILFGYNSEGIVGEQWDIFKTGGFNGMSNWAFMPCFAYLVKAVQFLTFSKIGVEYIATILNTVFMAAFLYNLMKYMRSKGLVINYALFGIIFVFHPLIPRFLTLYNEALFMLLVIYIIRYSDKKQFVKAGLLGAILTFTRLNGIVFFFYLLARIFQAVYQKQKGLIKDFFSAVLNIIKTPAMLFSLFVFPLGIFAFMSILKFSGLSPLAFLDVQSAWGKSNSFFLINIIKNIWSPDAIACVLAIVISIYLIIKKKKYLTPTLMIMCILMGATSSTASMWRYLICIVVFQIEGYKFLVYKTKMRSIVMAVLVAVFLASLYSTFFLYYPFIF
ncbi:MAG TPA: hypothetical protein VJZ69_02195 [Clostridia bacterium]|nr:hypothetical protein [Clostridia bacterium]